MFTNLLLEKEQQELLCTLVEASRNVRREQRQKFIAFGIMGESQAEIIHQGLPNGTAKAYMGDIETLAHEGLLSLSHERNLVNFDVLPIGFKYYEYLKQQAGQPLQQVTNYVQSYLAAESFQRKYSSAYQKWIQAETLLWSSDSEKQLTTIGHLCREALQEFATILIEEFRPSRVDEDPAHTVARIRIILDMQKDKLGSKEKPFLDALLSYWGTIIDIIQRQEHGAQKEGEPLVWDDGRRVVFQTAVIMHEVSVSLTHTK